MQTEGGFVKEREFCKHIEVLLPSLPKVAVWEGHQLLILSLPFLDRAVYSSADNTNFVAFGSS